MMHLEKEFTGNRILSFNATHLEWISLGWQMLIFAFQAVTKHVEENFHKKNWQPISLLKKNLKALKRVCCIQNISKKAEFPWFVPRLNSKSKKKKLFKILLIFSSQIIIIAKTNKWYNVEWNTHRMEQPYTEILFHSPWIEQPADSSE